MEAKASPQGNNPIGLAFLQGATVRHGLTQAPSSLIFVILYAMMAFERK